MKKIIAAVLFGMALTVLTNWISSREIKQESKAKEEKVIEKKATVTAKEKGDGYTGDWFGQNDPSVHITILGQDPKKPIYKVTIFQNGNQTYTFSLQTNSDGKGEVTNNSGSTFHLEFTRFYEKSSKQLKPSIEIYHVNNSTENASDKNFFIRAFR